jgi:hypothetical protein
VLQIPGGTGAAPAADERAQPPCTFAGFGAPALPPAAFAEFPVPAAVETAHLAPAVAAPRFAAPRRFPLARGPPLAA